MTEPARIIDVMFSDRLTNGATMAEMVYGLILVILLISALVARRRARGTAIRAATIWVVIAAGLLVAYGVKEEVMRLGRMVLAELVPHQGRQTDENTIAFRARNDGHFAVEASVNGTPILFMLDSGATDVILTPTDAKRIGLDLNSLRFDKPYKTANGLVRGAPVRLNQVAIGPIVLEDVRASVNGAPMETSLLGMSYLSRLSSWRVEGDRLTLVR